MSERCTFWWRRPLGGKFVQCAYWPDHGGLHRAGDAWVQVGYENFVEHRWSPTQPPTERNDMGIEDAFKNPDSSLSDEQMRMWLEDRKSARNTRTGLIFLSVVVVAIAAIVIAIVL